MPDETTRPGIHRVAFQFGYRYFFDATMKKTLLIVCAMAALSCDGGLSPTPPPKPGISGTVYFAKGTWPGTPSSPDSLSNLWIFASQEYPLDSALVLSGLFSSPPTVFLYPSLAANLPFYVDSVQYDFELPVGLYRYIGVIQHISPDYTSIRSLRVVGFFVDSADSSNPLQASVRDGIVTSGVNITVNFHNLPPQPF
jgi:hypothetical protein